MSTLLQRLTAVLLIAVGATSCAAPPFDAEAMVKEWSEFMQRDYVLRPSDQVAISVYQHDDLTQEHILAPDGTISLRRIVEPLKIGGMSISLAKSRIREVYSDVIQGTPEVSLSLTEVGASSVYVAGEVRRAGPVAYVPGMTVTQAIASAGGYTVLADPDDVRVVRNTGTTGAKTYRINVWRALHDEEPDFLVLPNDVVFCQTSTIADVGNWVYLYIVRLLPFPPQAAAI